MAEPFTTASARRIPRTQLVGGFGISEATATAWASRLLGRELDPYCDYPTVRNTIRDKLRPHGADFMNVSQDHHESVYMIVTQSRQFPQGYLGMDPKLIPQFTEGEPERTAKQLLTEEGK
jgi:hypothetical protein